MLISFIDELSQHEDLSTHYFAWANARAIRVVS